MKKMRFFTAKNIAYLAALTALIAAADAVTLVLLVLFAFAFTGRMVLPLEASQKKQQQFVAAASRWLSARKPSSWASMVSSL